jgi:ABC-type transport system involved in multi-copper enzyme maturation permease subunit
MQAVFSLARHTWIDALRERVFRGLALFLVVWLAAARLLDPLALGEGRRVTLDLGLALLSLFGFLLIMMLGTRVVQKEIDRKTILMLLARPISRGEFVLGKFLGITAVVGSGLLGMLLILAAVLWLSGYGVSHALIVAGLYAFLELLIVAALSMLLTVFTSPVLSAFFLLGLYVGGHLAPSLLEMARLVPSAVGRHVLEGLFLLVPRLDLYSYTLEVVHGWTPSREALLWAVAYALLYAAAALLVATLVFRRRQFS